MKMVQHLLPLRVRRGVASSLFALLALPIALLKYLCAGCQQGRRRLYVVAGVFDDRGLRLLGGRLWFLI